MRKPKNPTTVAGEDRRLNPAIGLPPGEFVQIDLTSLESELGGLLYADDSWAHGEDNALVNWTQSDSLTSDRREVQDWRGGCALPVHGALATHVLNGLLLDGEPFEMGTVGSTLTKLTTYGCDKEMKLARHALIDFKAVRAGKQQAGGVIWGTRRDWGSFSGKDMQVGSLHYSVIDFGGDILLDAHTQRTVGNVEKRRKPVRGFARGGGNGSACAR